MFVKISLKETPHANTKEGTGQAGTKRSYRKIRKKGRRETQTKNHSD